MKYIERAFPWLLIAPVALPVVVWSGVIYPYLVPKTLLFYAVSLATLAAFILLVAHGRVFYWARLAYKETWIPAALLVLAYGTSAVGIDFYRSFWSLFIRGDGLLMLTCVVANFYFILLYVDRAFFSRLLRATAIIGSFVAVYGIIEWLVGGGRIGSLLGNAAFFAGYLGITFFATLAAAHLLSCSWRRAAFVGAVLQVIAIFLTATRGTMLALAITGIAYLVYRAFTNEGTQRTRSAGALVVLIALSGLFFAFRSELSQSSFAPVARIASISLSDGTVSSRLFIWRNTVEEIKKSPWVGVGAEHIDVLFNRFYDPTQISEEWFDRSHNAFLDYAAQYGILGFLLYVALITLFITAARRLTARGERRIAGVFALLAITYTVQNFFVFDTISSFWLLLALLAALLAVSFGDDEPHTVLPLPIWVRTTSWPVAFVLVLFIVPASVRPALAAYDLAHGYTYQLTDVSKEVAYFSRGIARGTYADIEYGYQVYDIYVHRQVAMLEGQDLVDAYQASATILTTNFNRYLYDARTALYLAHVLSLVPPGVSVDEGLLSSALERAIRLSPKRSQPWYVLANLSISNANEYPPSSRERIAGYTAARDLLARYIALVPTLSKPHYVLAQLLFASGDREGAALEAEKGRVHYEGDLETARRAAVYYENVLDLTNAAYFLAEVIELDPSDTAAKSDLEKIQAYELYEQNL